MNTDSTMQELTTRMASLTLKESAVTATNDKDGNTDDPWAITDSNKTLISNTGLPKDQSTRHANTDGSEKLKRKDLLKHDENIAPRWETSNDGQQVAQLETQQNKWETGEAGKDDPWTVSEPWIDAETTDGKETKGSKTSNHDSAPTSTNKENFSDGWTINQDRRDSITTSPPMSPTNQGQWPEAHAFQAHNTNPQDTAQEVAAGFTRYGSTVSFTECC